MSRQEGRVNARDVGDGWSVVQEEVSGEAAKSFGRAEEGVIGGMMAYLFALDGIFWSVNVREL